jgi:hypothetical protein
MAKPITVEQFNKDVAVMWKQAVKESYEDLLQEAILVEREACAQIADSFSVPMCESSADAIAERIRARA